MEQRYFGYIPSPVDERDYNFADIVGASDSKVELPEEFRLDFNFNLDEYDQGQTNMCCAFALSMAKQLMDKTDEKYSPLSIYGNRSVTDYPGEGLIIRQAAAHTVNEGICYKKDFPFLYEVPEAQKIFNTNKDALLPKMAEHKFKTYFAINKEDVKRYIYTQKTPAIFAIPVYESFAYPDSTGKIKQNAGNFLGGHAVMCIGWTKDGEFIIPNTWSTAYGDKGYCYYNEHLDIREIWGLTNTEVEKPKKDYTLYRVQIGAYSLKENADATAKVLLNNKISSIIKYSDTDKLYRVQVGAYKDELNAYKMLVSILRKGYKGYIVTEE